MQLVRIAGPKDAMLRLHDVEGLHFERASATRLEGDMWQVAGYATDDALAELRARGLQTELVAAAEQVAEERSILYGAIGGEPADETPAADDPAGGEA